MNAVEQGPRQTPGARMMYLIRRKPLVSRDQLIVHWFAHHMPSVIRTQRQRQEAKKPHAWRYLATLFRENKGRTSWDGLAQLYWDRPLPKSKRPFGSPARDSFQQKAEPYWSWATVEYVVVDGADRLPITPLTLNEPFPCTRSGFFKVSSLVKAKPGTDFSELFAHWLENHTPNVRDTLLACGGFRYVLSLSLDPVNEPYAGLAELYFAEERGWDDFLEALPSDGMEQWLDPKGSKTLYSDTEMIGIP